MERSNRLFFFSHKRERNESRGSSLYIRTVGFRFGWKATFGARRMAPRKLGYGTVHTTSLEAKASGEAEVPTYNFTIFRVR